MPISIMLSHAPAELLNNWEFVELWIDPIVFPPRLLMLVSEKGGKCCIYDPTEQYKSIFSSSTYEGCHSWLLEDEYERVDGRLLAAEIVGNE